MLVLGLVLACAGAGVFGARLPDAGDVNEVRVGMGWRGEGGMRTLVEGRTFCSVLVMLSCVVFWMWDVGCWMEVDGFGVEA